MTLPPHAQNPGSAVTLFDNGEFRLEFEPDGNGGFRVDAPAVARQLGFREAHDLLRNIPAGEKGSALARTPNGGQRTYLTEAGFYRALGQRQVSRIADAGARSFVERFQAWVFGDVLPKLRRGEVATRPTSELDILRRAIDQIEHAQQAAARAELAAIEATKDARVANARIDAMEGRHNWFSALGYAIDNGMPTDSVSLARFGKVAASIARADGIEPNKVQHAHFGKVNEFPLHVWDRARQAMGGAA